MARAKSPPHHSQLMTDKFIFEKWSITGPKCTRNIEIVTFDELFERAFHIVFTDKLPSEWYSIPHEVFKSDIFKSELMADIKLFESKRIRSAWNEAEEKWYFSV